MVSVVCPELRMCWPDLCPPHTQPIKLQTERAVLGAEKGIFLVVSQALLVRGWRSWDASVMMEAALCCSSSLGQELGAATSLLASVLHCWEVRKGGESVSVVSRYTNIELAVSLLLGQELWCWVGIAGTNSSRSSWELQAIQPGSPMGSIRAGGKTGKF